MHKAACTCLPSRGQCPTCCSCDVCAGLKSLWHTQVERGNTSCLDTCASSCNSECSECQSLEFNPPLPPVAPPSSAPEHPSPPPQSWAPDVRVISSVSELAAALNDSSPHISINSGSYDCWSQLEIQHDVVVEAAIPGMVVLNGKIDPCPSCASSRSIFRITKGIVQLKGLNFTSVAAQGIAILGGAVVLHALSIYGFEGFGGVVVSSGSVEVSSCSFHGNRFAKFGSGSFWVDNINFGGSLYVGGGTLHLKACRIYDNEADRSYSGEVCMPQPTG